MFDYAALVVLDEVPDADIPLAVRESGVPVGQARLGSDLLASVRKALHALLVQVEGSVAVVAPPQYAAALAVLAEADPRVHVVEPLAAKGLEWDATVVVDPARIRAEAPGGVRTLYVCLTRAAHRMTVLH